MLLSSCLGRDTFSLPHPDFRKLQLFFLPVSLALCRQAAAKLGWLTLDMSAINLLDAEGGISTSRMLSFRSQGCWLDPHLGMVEIAAADTGLADSYQLLVTSIVDVVSEA